MDTNPIPINDDTKPDDKVVSIVRAEIRRAQREANERDLLRALNRIRPDDDPEVA